MALETITTLLSLVLIAVTVAFAVTVGHYRRRLEAVEEERDEEEFRRRSLATTYGKITEQFAPLLDAYPWDSQDFRFLGSPIDGVQFADDRVVFVEFKTNESSLSPTQSEVKRMVERGDVEWRTFRVDAEEGPDEESLDRWT
jgi:predicted Holliday junction resolvase-like endonuclease